MHLFRIGRHADFPYIEELTQHNLIIYLPRYSTNQNMSMDSVSCYRSGDNAVICIEEKQFKTVAQLREIVISRGKIISGSVRSSD